MKFNGVGFVTADDVCSREFFVAFSNIPSSFDNFAEGVVTDATVDVDAGGTLSGGGLPGEEDSQSDRKEMKSEPGDAMAEMYSESSEMSTDPQSHPGEGMDPRQAIMYPIGGYLSPPPCRGRSVFYR